MKYQINKKISSGAFGVVYEGINLENNEQIAVKQVFVSKKVQREVEIHEMLNHPNVVKLHQYQIKEQTYSMFMEYCEYDLQQFIQTSIYPLTKQTIQSIAYQILSGMEHIHSLKIVHRDLKPSNIMIHQNQMKIGDFGSAELLSKLEKAGQYSTEGFSKWYMAPEMLFGSRNYSTEVDIWSFGCIYAELLVGLPLFTGKGEIDQIVQIANLLGSPSEDNWPNVKLLPDYGKINFKAKGQQDFREYFDLATDLEVDFLKTVLRYQDRLTARELLQHKYFEDVPMQVEIVCSAVKEQYNPYYKYL